MPEIIVILGHHGIFREHISEILPGSLRYSYFRSLFDYDQNEGNGKQDVRRLIAEQRDFDARILHALTENSLLFIEQWYIGTLAYIRSYHTKGYNVYSNYAKAMLLRFDNFTVKWFFISISIKEYPDAFRKTYVKVLGNLSELLDKFEITTENIDGEVSKEDLQARLRYLLDLD